MAQPIPNGTILLHEAFKRFCGWMYGTEWTYAVFGPEDPSSTDLCDFSLARSARPTPLDPKNDLVELRAKAENEFCQIMAQELLQGILKPIDGRRIKVPSTQWLSLMNFSVDFEDSDCNLSLPMRGTSVKIVFGKLLLFTSELESFLEYNEPFSAYRMPPLSMSFNDRDGASEMLPEGGGSAQDVEMIAKTVDPYRDGYPGRPTIKHLILAEFCRRREADECQPTLKAEAEALQNWAKENHRKPKTPSVKTIENQIRSPYWQSRSGDPTK